MRRRASPACSILPDVAALLARYLSERWDTPVAIAGLKRFHGGAARETWRFDAVTTTGRQGLVLRRDPASTLIETDRSLEFRALQAFHGSAVPVPEPLFCEAGAEAFGSPGFIMREVAGGHAATMFEVEPYGDQAAAVGRAFFTALGVIHRADPAAIGQPAMAPADAAAARVAHWRQAYEADRLRPEPMIDAAFRWLERTPVPPPARVTVVHGDYRSGNFLFASGAILAILDWEMVHAGDPLEDLAWALDPLWSHGSGRPAATLPEADAIACWESASGLACDRGALGWWRVFAQVQGLSIWVSSAAEIAAGRSHDPVLAFAGVLPYRFHLMTLAEHLRGLA